MSPADDEAGRGLPPRALAVTVLLAGGFTLYALKDSWGTWAGSLTVVLSNAGLAGGLLASAGGWAWPVVRRIAPRDTHGLKLATAVMLGLWMLATSAQVAWPDVTLYALPGE